MNCRWTGFSIVLVLAGVWIHIQTVAAQVHVVSSSSSEADSLERAALQGDRRAQSLLTMQSWWGIERAPNLTQARRWAEHASVHDALAQFILAECYQATVPPQYRKADSLYGDARVALTERAQQGDSYAMVALAQYYERGLGDLEPNDERADSLYRQACDAKNPVALYHALLRRFSLGLADSVAVAWLAESAAQRFIPAMISLARQLLTDSATAAQGVELLREAHQRGSTEALYLLGGCYDSGLGCQRNSTVALQCFAEAADGGNIAAMLELSFRLLHGIGLRADTIESLRWMLQALAQVDHHAHRRDVVRFVQTICDSIPAVRRVLPKAFHVHQLAVFAPDLLDSARALYYLRGDGVRLWRCAWSASVAVPQMLVVGAYGKAQVLLRTDWEEATWDRTSPNILRVLGTHHRWEGKMLLLGSAVLAIAWGNEYALYVPAPIEYLETVPHLRHSSIARPEIEALPVRSDGKRILLRFHMTHIPLSGVVLVPLGIARSGERAAQYDVRSQSFFAWEDGVVEFWWEPQKQELPAQRSGRWVMMMQCSWHFDGYERTLLVKSQPFALPEHLQRP